MIRMVRGLTPSHQRALVFCDQETFGFGKTQPLIEWAGIKRKADGTEETLDVKLHVTRYEIEHAEPGALAVNGFTLDGWAQAMPKSQALELIHNFIASTTIVGFSLDGDIRRLEREFDCSEIPTVRRWVEPLEMTTLLRARHPEWPSFNLDEACKKYGIEQEGVHRAMGGAMRAKAVFDRFVGGA